jgi:hypothetical protein
MKRPLLAADIICGLFIFLFVYTALSKLNTLPQFRAVLQQSPLLSNRSQFFSLAIPVTEIVISLLLLFPRSRSWGLYGAFALMLTFTLYITYMINYTPQLPCSCGGVLKQLTWQQHLVFNIVFTLLSLTGILLRRRRPENNSNNSGQFTIA